MRRMHAYNRWPRFARGLVASDDRHLRFLGGIASQCGHGLHLHGIRIASDVWPYQPGPPSRPAATYVGPNRLMIKLLRRETRDH